MKDFSEGGDDVEKKGTDELEAELQNNTSAFEALERDFQEVCIPILFIFLDLFSLI